MRLYYQLYTIVIYQQHAFTLGPDSPALEFLSHVYRTGRCRRRTIGANPCCQRRNGAAPQNQRKFIAYLVSGGIGIDRFSLLERDCLFDCARRFQHRLHYLCILEFRVFVSYYPICRFFSRTVLEVLPVLRPAKMHCNFSCI